MLHGHIKGADNILLLWTHGSALENKMAAIMQVLAFKCRYLPGVKFYSSQQH